MPRFGGYPQRVSQTRNHVLNVKKREKMDTSPPPILRSKMYDHVSLFEPENMLREARRQNSIPEGELPHICILDPDGDILSNLLSNNRTKINSYWACYHTKLYNFEYEDIEFGIIGCAVGASFAVLIAEELFASGCQLLISVTSSGLILPKKKPPFFVLIERALRDEGTSYHYMQPSDYSYINKQILAMLADAFSDLTIPVNRGTTWTTDAPFRETAIAIEQAKSRGILAVEMEASALYAFAHACHKAVICFAHVTNQMGNIEGDFEKGQDNGSRDALKLIAATAKAWFSSLV
jgi:uridine phosphorylase